MDPSSALPPGVDPSELYTGPQPGNVSAFPSPPRPKFVPITTDEDRDTRAKQDYVAVITAWVDILSARLLALIGVIAACVMFCWAVYDPTPWRLYAAVAFAMVVVWPNTFVYLKRG